MFTSLVWGSNEIFEVDLNHFCVETLIFPFGPLWADDEGECFAPYIIRKPLATPRGQSLWILCASTRDLWIWGNFCNFIWLRGGVFWTLSSLQIVTLLVELWWSGKLTEPPWNHLGSSWIISEIFKNIHKIVILDIMLTIFCHRSSSCWNLWS